MRPVVEQLRGASAAACPRRWPAARGGPPVADPCQACSSDLCAKTALPAKYGSTYRTGRSILQRIPSGPASIRAERLAFAPHALAAGDQCMSTQYLCVVAELGTRVAAGKQLAPQEVGISARGGRGDLGASHARPVSGRAFVITGWAMGMPIREHGWSRRCPDSPLVSKLRAQGGP